MQTLDQLNQEFRERYAINTNIQARTQSYQLAARMQLHAPAVVDFSKESESVKAMYGIGEKETDDFGRQFLLARRLAEQGVRFIQLCHAGGGNGGRDAHGDTKTHGPLCRAVDKPIAGSISDLKQRGMLDSTLVVFSSEFGKSPWSQNTTGRDHNPKGYTVCLAGGGVKGVTIHGATDDAGYKAVESPHYYSDLRATILHQLVLDYRKMEFGVFGRTMRLVEEGSGPIKEILAYTLQKHKMIRYALLSILAALVCTAQEGSQVFISHCLQCHSSTSTSHAPTPEALAQIPWQDVLKTLETGSMKVQAERLSKDDKIAVARFVGKEAAAQVLPEVQGFCMAGAKPSPTKSSWNGWGVDEINTRFQPRPAAGITAAEVPSLKVKWAFGYPTGRTAYGQPTVVGGRVYTGSNDGTIYALDANTGCVYWMYRAKALVRSGVVVGPDKRAYVGDLDANMYALDTETGKLIWQKKLDDQPYARITGTPKLHEGRLYVPIASQEENAGANPIYPCCKFRGNLVAVEARTGAEVWRTYTSPEPKPTKVGKNGVQFYGPSGATIWSSPTIDLKRKLIYVMTGNGYSDPDIKTADAIIALDIQSGRIRWSTQATPDMFNWDCGSRTGGGNCPENHGPDQDFGSSAVLLDAGHGKQVLVAGQKSGVVHAFDPDQNGKIVWQTRVGKGSVLGGVLWGIAGHNGVAYVPLSDMDRRKPETGGGMFALDAASGKILWTTPPPKPPCLGKPGCTAAQLAPPSLIEGIVFAGSMDGHLRAYEMAGGKIVWDFDATQSFPTTDGIQANGGSFSSTGPTIAGGILYVNSGYGGQGMGGNVLLAFSAR